MWTYFSWTKMKRLVLDSISKFTGPLLPLTSLKCDKAWWHTFWLGFYLFSSNLDILSHTVSTLWTTQILFPGVSLSVGLCPGREFLLVRSANSQAGTTQAPYNISKDFSHLFTIEYRSFLKFSQCPQTGPLSISVTIWRQFSDSSLAPMLSPDRYWHDAFLVAVTDLSPCAQIWELMRTFYHLVLLYMLSMEFFDWLIKSIYFYKERNFGRSKFCLYYKNQESYINCFFF